MYILSPKEFLKQTVPLVTTMSRFDSNMFGEAGPFLRKTDLELMAAQGIAFDGNPLIFKLLFDL